MQTSSVTDADDYDDEEIQHGWKQSLWELSEEDRRYEIARSASRAAGRRLQELRRQEHVAG